MIKNILYLLAPILVFGLLTHCSPPTELVVDVALPKNQEGEALVEIVNLAESGRYYKGAVVILEAEYTASYAAEKITWAADDEHTVIDVLELKDAAGKTVGEKLVFVPEEDLKIVGKATATSKTRAREKDLNEYVLRAVSTYEIGKYPYLLNDDYANYNGVTENIIYQGRTLAKANPGGDRASHCVGITFEVFFKAMQARNEEAGLSPHDFNGMLPADLEDFLLTWYVAKGPAYVDNLVGAMENYGIGRRIVDFEKAKPGDFIQLFRPNSGHAVVFIDWVRAADGEILGLKYWSSQGSTNGIAYVEEYFSDNPKGPRGGVDRKNLYIGRVNSIKNYKPFGR
ncbi:MAG TPA: hypothetical protein GX528_02265 [Firmicutes bacterium]|nr:hypothetical protein [Bacillota bacterium]